MCSSDLATTSAVHTAVKIAPAYRGLTVHVTDASRSVQVAARAVSVRDRPGLRAETDERYARLRDRHAQRDQGRSRVSLDEARANALPLDPDALPPRPASPGRHRISVPVAELIERIDWGPFFLAWELPGRWQEIARSEERRVGKEC